MPLLDIAVSQPCSCFGNSRLTFRSRTIFRNTYLIGNERRLRLASTFSWKTLCITEKLWKHYTLERSKADSGRFTIKAVATLEIMSVPQTNEGVKGCQNVLRMDLDSIMSNHPDSTTESSSEDSTDVDEMEKLRRMKISKANKGKTPWNKGRKHSPETLQRIKERTRLAMQDPKVKMKLINLGHAQSDETRIKIGLGVRLGWERRREKLMVQETCHHEWQNLVAVAAKKGLSGEEELQWDSFEILSEVLEKEWLESVEQRKNITRIKGNRRAPKSEEQKRKIAEAIATKWADPEYRNRVCKSKNHGTPEGVERRPRRRLSGDGLPQKRSRKKVELGDLSKHETKSPIERIRSKRSKTPLYKDPLASSKLEMLKNIRAQRAASEDKESVAISRARWFIAEAEKASKALEISAMMNPLAEASLLESRMLIAEANQIIESIELKCQETIPFEKGKTHSEISTSPVPNLENEKDPDAGDLIIAEPIKVNGVKSKSEMLKDFVLPHQVNGNASMPFPCNMVKTDETLQHMTGSNGHLVEANLNCSSREGLKCNSNNLEGPKKQIKVIKKWVRGRLVEVEEAS